MLQLNLIKPKGMKMGFDQFGTFGVDGNIMALNRHKQDEDEKEANQEAFYQKIKDDVENLKELAEHIKAVAIDFNEEDYAEQLLEDTISEA